MKNIISKLNKTFENRIRLGIMSILMVNDWADYNTLKELLDVTDGNLASHLSHLEKSEMIELRKQFVGRKPNTRYRVTKTGRQLFQQHLELLQKIIQSNQ